MAYEWVAPVAVASVGVTGIVVTSLTGSKARAQAAELAEKQRVQMEKAAVDERNQQRKAEAHVHCLELAEQLGHWAQMLRPWWDTYPPAELPPLPELKEQAAMQARLLAYGSENVATLWDAWNGSINDVRRAGRKLDLYDAAIRSQTITRIDQPEVIRELEDELRPRELERRKRLADKINAELAGDA